MAKQDQMQWRKQKLYSEEEIAIAVKVTDLGLLGTNIYVVYS